MSGGEVSMPVLFQAAVEVLTAERCPLHYAALTQRALGLLGAPHAGILRDAGALRKNAENVREKLLARGRAGTLYLGGAWASGALQRWFRSASSQGALFGSIPGRDTVCIPGHATAAAEGAYTMLMRADYLEDKYASVDPDRRARGRARGYILESQVVSWFATHYPRFYRPADNHRQWAQWCAHDFKLALPSRVLHVDVAGPSLRGPYLASPHKQVTDVHLLCRLQDDHCVFEGVLRGSAFTGAMTPATAGSPVNFLVWLNCLSRGLPYDAWCAAARALP